VHIFLHAFFIQPSRYLHFCYW